MNRLVCSCLYVPLIPEQGANSTVLFFFFYLGPVL